MSTLFPDEPEREASEMAAARRAAWEDSTEVVDLECGHRTRVSKLNEFGKPTPYGRCARHATYQRIVRED